jgi:hypothetical protein
MAIRTVDCASTGKNFFSTAVQGVYDHRDDTSCEVYIVGARKPNTRKYHIRCENFANVPKELSDIRPGIGAALWRCYGGKPNFDTPYATKRAPIDEGSTDEGDVGGAPHDDKN